MDYYDWIIKHCNVGNIMETRIELKCVFHDDEHASLSIDRKTGRWKCFGCGKSGHIGTLAKKLGVELPEKLRQFTAYTEALTASYKYAVEKAHERLMSMEQVVRERLRTEWNLDEALIRKLQLGWEEERLWIPIYYSNQLVNIRKYKFNAERAKVISIKGVKSVYIYPMEVAYKNNDVIIVEGEKDAIVGLAHGLPCITFTGGANTVPTKKQLQHLLHKNVAVCYDCDDAGKKGGEKVVNSLKKVADYVTIIALPHKELGRGGDLTDFFRTGHTVEEFNELRHTAKQRWPVPKFEPEKDDTTHTLSLHNSRLPEWYQKRMIVRARCIGKTLQPFSIPNKGVIDCMERGTKDLCSMCAMSNKEETEQLKVELDELESGDILSFVKCTTFEQKKALSGVFGLACQHWEWIQCQHLNVEQLIVSQDPLQEGEEENLDETPIYHEAYFVGSLAMDENLTYSFTGRQVAHPRNQQVTHMFSEAITPEGFLQGTPHDVDWTDLRIFQVERN